MASWKELKAASEEGDLEAGVIWAFGQIIVWGVVVTAFLTIAGVIVFHLVK